MVSAKKYALYALLVAGLVLLGGCQSLDMLTNVHEDSEMPFSSATADSLWLAAHVARPGADSLETLTAYSAGFVKVTGHSAYLEKWTTWSPQRIAALKERIAAAADWDSPAPGGAVLTPQGVYDIHYTESKRDEVGTNQGASRYLVNMIDSTIAAVLEDGLVLALETVAETRNAIRGHRITLTLKNSGAEYLPLQFPPNQGAEFLIYERGAAFGSAPARRYLLRPPIANALNSALLRNGQPVSFAVFWDGKNEQGDPLHGAATIAGRLLSRPGGAPPMQSIILEP